MLWKVCFYLYLSSSPLIYDSITMGVSPTNSSGISSFPSATDVGTSGGPRPLEIDQDIIWDNLAAQEQEARAGTGARPHL